MSGKGNYVVKVGEETHAELTARKVQTGVPVAEQIRRALRVAWAAEVKHHA